MSSKMPVEPNEKAIVGREQKSWLVATNDHFGTDSGRWLRPQCMTESGRTQPSAPAPFAAGGPPSAPPGLRSAISSASLADACRASAPVPARTHLPAFRQTQISELNEHGGFNGPCQEQKGNTYARPPSPANGPPCNSRPAEGGRHAPRAALQERLRCMGLFRRNGETASQSRLAAIRRPVAWGCSAGFACVPFAWG